MAPDEPEDIERLVRQAREDPDAVSVESIVSTLGDASGTDRDRAVGALYEISKSGPCRLVDTLARLASLLDCDRPTVRSKALLTMSKVGAVQPEALKPHADALTRALEDDSRMVRRSAARAVGALATGNPSAAEPAVPSLVAMLESDSEPSRRRAVEVLRTIVADESAGVDVPVEPLLDVVENRHETPPDLGYDPKLASETASANDQMRGLRTLANDDNERSETARVRENAAEILAIQAANDPEAMAATLEPHRDRLAAVLDDRNPTIRGATVGVLSYVAEHDPSAVRSIEDRLVGLLEEPVGIGGNAIWALRFAESERAIDAIRAIVDDDGATDELRSVARRALADFDASSE